MARAVTIEQLEADVRWLADQQEAELRHTSSDLRRAINHSIQAFREGISDNGFSYFLTEHSGTLDPGNAVSQNDTKLAWGVLETRAWDPEVVRVYGVDVTVNGSVLDLGAVSFNERNRFQYYNNESGVPQNFFGYNETTLGIVPPPNRAYNYVVWYLPALPELVNDGDEFNPGVPGAEQWIKWDVMYMLLNRDNYPRLLASVAKERQRLWDDILHRANKLQRSGPMKRLDTRGWARAKSLYRHRSWLYAQ